MKLLIIKLNFNIGNSHIVQLCAIIQKSYNKFLYLNDEEVVVMKGTSQELKTVIGCANEWDIDFTLQDWNS